MDLQTIIKKLEMNESVISTFLGGVVMMVVVVLLVSYFQSKSPESVQQAETSVGSVAGDLDLSGIGEVGGGSTSSTQVTRYTVKQGETLWRIASNLLGDGHRWVEIARINNLGSGDLIETGMELDIPGFRAEEVKTDSSEQMITKNHLVQKGETLWSIAAQTMGDPYRWQELWSANKDQVSNQNVLVEGVLLTIPTAGQS